MIKDISKSECNSCLHVRITYLKHTTCSSRTFAPLCATHPETAVSLITARSRRAAFSFPSLLVESSTQTAVAGGREWDVTPRAYYEESAFWERERFRENGIHRERSWKCWCTCLCVRGESRVRWETEALGARGRVFEDVKGVRREIDDPFASRKPEARIIREFLED